MPLRKGLGPGQYLPWHYDESMLKAVVIDDELHSRELMATLLNDYCSGVEVCGVAGKVSEGVALIQRTKPEVVFLDLEMPGGDGLALLEAFPEPVFKFAFVTGYAAGKMELLEASSVAWLRKPVDLDELQKVLEGLGQRQLVGRKQLEVIWNEIAPTGPRVELTLAEGEDTEALFLGEIAFVEGRRGHTLFHLVDGREKLAMLRLQHYEKLLPPDRFFKTHRSWMVNLDEVQGLEGSRSSMLLFKNGRNCPLAARRRTAFVEAFKTRFNLF